MKFFTFFLVIMAICFMMPTLAFAQSHPAAKTTSGKVDRYGYTFSDDPLNAGGFGANDAVIKIRPRAARATLIRPRTSFVPEMLRSVDDI